MSGTDPRSPAPPHPGLFPHLFPHPRRCGLPGWWVTLLVAAGGMAGAVARAGAGLAGPAYTGGFPWTTCTVNLAGGAAMGVLMTALARRPKAPLWLGPVLGTGFLGGFTTFSSFAVEVYRLLTGTRPPTALGYAAATIAGTLGTAACGAAATSRLLTSAPEPPAPAGVRGVGRTACGVAAGAGPRGTRAR
ncbi:CrcB family protein [Streptomyces sp. B8F3]|uniref:fluoride efflux transporter FluC n=1 Tax=Streptomyces sp. B8F3 TaxID=3153573 RepID=UPI00325E542F